MEVVQHAWVLSCAGQEEFKIPGDVVHSMHRYATKNGIKKWVSYMVSLIIEEKHIIQIKQLFIQYDKNHNGFIDPQEFAISRPDI